ncbi:MAG: hypothetical protein HYV38_03200 [Candidatus Levybacteria bacterium]|nr:hypothetical protein [Candidatus Levybacteria bacterium]MBI2421064.1 hypothetical protein [Candidatus Levybacteria bacterium]MBI4097754.1 hypothetical protein [Candidatus Levybacteria bacterium]
MIQNSISKLALSIPQFGEVKGPPGVPTGGKSSVYEIIQFGIELLIVGGILLALVFLIYGGVQWITSGGSKGGVEAARNKIIYAIIGLVVIFLSFFIINFIEHFFKINLIR